MQLNHLRAPSKIFRGRTEQIRWVGSFLVSRNHYAPGLRLGSHVHCSPFISAVCDGSYFELCGSSVQACTSSTVIYHPAGEGHSDRFEAEGASVLSIDLASAARNVGIVDRLSATRMEVTDAQFLARQINREFGEPCHTSDLVIESLAFELMGNCVRKRRKLTRRTPGWLPLAIELVNEHYGERLTLAEVAQLIGVHPVHLARHFRRRMGCTFGEFLRRIRLSRALTELRTSNKPVAEISANTGFADQSHMTRLLQATMGITPAAYRRTYRSKK
jgi:AraC family transcriptional regulator